MRILISSNAPYAPTGYGTQGKWLSSWLSAMGHDVFYMAWYGLDGGVIQTGKYTILPKLGHPYGGDAGIYTYRYDIDVIITIQDLWPLPVTFKDSLNPKTKWVAWYPVDGEPLTKAIAERLITSDFPLVYSKYGQQIVNESGLQTGYCPLATETSVYKVGSKSEARQRLGWDSKKTYLSMVAMNKGFPSRKGFVPALQAFKRFNQSYPESVLYLHTKAQEPHGLDLVKIAKTLGIPEGAILFVNQLEYTMGMDNNRVADVYRASDALLMPTMGEGFGLPIVEAQACGCPVIAHNCSSVEELVHGGVLFDRGAAFWNQQGQWHFMPDSNKLTNAMYRWQLNRDEIAERTITESSQFVAQNYSTEAVALNYWLPLLSQIEQEVIPV